MSSFGSQCNPRANVFLVINLGCEMLYVIDQRLQAQQIEKARATQVFNEITTVLLDPKFIESLINFSLYDHSETITPQHCRHMLKDVATRSVMSLDVASMDKLWNLMTVVYKWQLFVSKYPHHLLENTFRHLDSIAKLHPNVKSSLLVDYTKNILLDFWNACDDETQLSIYRTNKFWLQCFNTKISLLVRLGFQNSDGNFSHQVDEWYFDEFVQSAGKNIYRLSVDIAEKRKEELFGQRDGIAKSILQLQAEILGTPHAQQGNELVVSEDESQKPQEHEMLEHTNTKNNELPKMVFDMNIFPGMVTYNPKGTHSETAEFASIKTVYNRNSETSSGNDSNKAVTLNKELLEIYNKMH